MNEYINRDEAINAIKKIYCPQCNSYNGAMCRACEHMDDMDIIEDMPAANVQPVAEYNKWINAKEQKPEACEDVLVLFEYYFCGGNTTKLKIGTAYYVKTGDKWLGDDLYVLPKANVLYWQPKTAESGD